MRRATGFTLIELMVVIAIIGILAATSIPSSRIYLNQARLLAAEVTIQQAVRDYSVQKGYSPAMLEDLVSAGFLNAIPNDPWTSRQGAIVATDKRRPSYALIPSAHAAAANLLGIEEAGDWFYSNDGQTVIFYARSHPGRTYTMPSFGLPPLATPNLPTPPSTPPAGATPPATPPTTGNDAERQQKKEKKKAEDARENERKKAEKKKEKEKKEAERKKEQAKKKAENDRRDNKREDSRSNRKRD